MRIGLIINLAPRKLGSLEGWLVGMAKEARRRGHELAIFGRRPIHPEIERQLEALGVPFGTTDELEANKVAGVRRLAGFDVLHVNMFQPRTAPAVMAYAAWPAKVIMIDHTSGYPKSTESAAREAFSRAIDKVSLARVDELVGVSEYVRKRDEERFGLQPARTRVVYNGVDVSRYAPRAEGVERSGAMKILCVAHLIPEKGVDVLLRAVSMMKEPYELQIAGDGHKADELKRLCTSLALDGRVQFVGLRDDVPELLQRSDVLVHPAVWQEAFGLTITEGMAAGCAVVASKTGGIPEIIRQGVDGLLVHPGDAKALAIVLDRLAAAPALRAELGRNARRRVEENFSLHLCVSNHLDCIEQVAFDTRSVGVRKHAPAKPGEKNVIVGQEPREEVFDSPAQRRSEVEVEGPALRAED